MTTYKIIGFDKSNGVLSVKFADNMAALTIDVPINEQGEYITGEELNSYIQGFIPTWHLDRVNKIAAGIPNESAIESLVQAQPAVETAPTPQQEIQSLETVGEWQQQQAEDQIVGVLVKLGLVPQGSTT